MWSRGGPVVVLHYAADAQEPVTYFYNDTNRITKDHLAPGQAKAFRADFFPEADSYINVSLPFASRDGVEFKPPFSRVDIYINSATKIDKVETKYGFLDRFEFNR
jgi:hypothetical protein